MATTTDALKALTTRIQLEAFGEANTETIAELFAAELRPKIEELVTGVRAAFPDMEMRVDVLVAEDDRCVCRWRARGTHGGMFMNVPATGAKVQWSGVSIYRFNDSGTVVDMVGNWDMYGIMVQLRAALAGT